MAQISRRTFLTLMGLGWLASLSPSIIAAALAQVNPSAASHRQLKKIISIEFYIAPNGNDNWSGTSPSPNIFNTDGPFATIKRARDEIRNIKYQQGGTLQQPVVVFVRGGTYFLQEPLVFAPQDSGTTDCPVTYKNYQDEKVIVSGGRSISDWRKVQGNLWSAQLPDLEAEEWYFRLLRVGDTWAIRARYPKFDSQNPLTDGWLFAKWWNGATKPWEKGAFNAAVGGIHNVGSRLEWNIVVPVARQYKIWIRYGNNMKRYGIEAMDGRTAIRIRTGETVLLRNLPDTGSFSNFHWTLTGTVYIESGEQILVWENIQGGGLALDAFCLTDDSDWNPDSAIRIINQQGEAEVQPPSTGKQLIVIQAEACNKAVGRDVDIPNPGNRDRIVIASEQFPDWQNWEGAEVHTFCGKGWVNTVLPINKVNKERQTVFVSSSRDIQPGNRFFIANVREALNNPDEWYLDVKEKNLLYWPIHEEFYTKEVVAPVMDRLIVLEGDAQQELFVEHIHFRGLTFRDTDYTLNHSPTLPSYTAFADAGLWLSAARNCVVENCNFINLGGYGVRIEERSHKNEIISNKMNGLGQGGVVLLSENRARQPFSNLIAANEIEDCGKIYKHVAGVYVMTGSRNRIVHNRIQRMPRYGISLKSLGTNNYSHNNIVEYNEIYDTNLETFDTGAIETLGQDRQPSGNIIRFNYIRNVVGMGATPDGRLVSPHFTWGIYLDDYSSGTTVYGNIVVGTVLGSVCIHGGKDNTIDNNIFVNGLEHQIRLQPRNEFMVGNRFRKNIVVFDNQQAELWYSWPSRWRPDCLAECNFNLYWHTDGLDLKNTEKPITPEGSFSKWQALGFDLNSEIADPLFVNLETGDFRLQESSPAFKLGFQTLPLDIIGLKGFRRSPARTRRASNAK